MHRTPSSQARILAAISPAAAPDHSRYANLQTDTFENAGLVLSAGRNATAAFATAPILAGTLGISIAGRSGWKAFGARFESETGQCDCGKAEAESFEGLPPRYALRHTFSHLVEFVVHNRFLSLSVDLVAKI
jgi:hypothetical protein